MAGDPVPSAALVVPHKKAGKKGNYGSITVPYDHDASGAALTRAALTSIEHGASRKPMFVAVAAPSYVVMNDGSGRPPPRPGREMEEAYASGDERVHDAVMVNVVTRGSRQVYLLPFASPLMSPLIDEAVATDEEPGSLSSMLLAVMGMYSLRE